MRLTQDFMMFMIKKTGSKKNGIQNRELKIRIAEKNILTFQK